RLPSSELSGVAAIRDARPIECRHGRVHGRSGARASAAREDLAVRQDHPAVRVVAPGEPPLADRGEGRLVAEAALHDTGGELRLLRAVGPEPSPPVTIGVALEAPDGCAGVDVGEPGLTRPRLEVTPRIRGAVVLARELLVGDAPEL